MNLSLTWLLLLEDDHPATDAPYVTDADGAEVHDADTKDITDVP